MTPALYLLVKGAHPRPTDKVMYPDFASITTLIKVLRKY